jgi:ribosomal protein L4
VKIPVHNLTGDTIDEIEVDDSIFGVPFREGVVHQAVKRLLPTSAGNSGNQDAGRGHWQHTQLYAQKGTGRARAAVSSRR